MSLGRDTLPSIHFALVHSLHPIGYTHLVISFRDLCFCFCAAPVKPLFVLDSFASKASILVVDVT